MAGFNVERFIQQHGAPSKRTVKNKAGSMKRRVDESYTVGGTKNQIRAIYDDFVPTYARPDEKGLSSNPDTRGSDYKAPQGQWLGRVPCM